MGKNIDFRSIQKERLEVSDRCYLCKGEEETMDLILFHCSKAVML